MATSRIQDRLLLVASLLVFPFALSSCAEGHRGLIADGDVPADSEPAGDGSVGEDPFGSGGTTAGQGTDGDGTPGDAQYPSEVLDLSRWALTIPIDTDHEGDPDRIVQPELGTFASKAFFHLNESGNGVVFRAFADGESSSGYPRTELRERTADGDSMSWTSTGKHSMVIEQEVTHLPDVQPDVIVGQLIDDGDDVLSIRLQGTRLFIDLDGKEGPMLTPSCALGTKFTVSVEVEDDTLSVLYNGELRYSADVELTDAYFKAGVSLRTACAGSKQVPGEACSAHGEAVIHRLEVLHP